MAFDDFINSFAGNAGDDGDFGAHRLRAFEAASRGRKSIAGKAERVDDRRFLGIANHTRLGVARSRMQRYRANGNISESKRRQ